MEKVYNHPFGITPTENQIKNAIEKTREVYADCPETTCSHKADCCRTACPNMYYGEFLSIREGAVMKMTDIERVNLTVECIKRYLLEDTKPKPCVFLAKDNNCSIYKYRHLKCRLYGLIPPETYERAVNEVAKEQNVIKEAIPLWQQCPFVKIKPEFADKFPNNIVPESVIKVMEKTMKEIDRTLGIAKKTQEMGFGFLTYHDWHLLYEFGEDWLEKLTHLRLKLKDHEKDQFVSAVKQALENALKPTFSVKPTEGAENER